MPTEAQKKSASKRQRNLARGPKARRLYLSRNADGTFTDQYGRLLAEYVNTEGQNDLRPVGIDPRGGAHA
jgi:hypothetical protein